MNAHFVRVTTDDREHHIWAAATSREDAIDRVLDQVPEGWSACFIEDAEPHLRAVIDMAPGEVRELRKEDLVSAVS